MTFIPLMTREQAAERAGKMIGLLGDVIESVERGPDDGDEVLIVELRISGDPLAIWARLENLVGEGKIVRARQVGSYHLEDDKQVIRITAVPLGKADTEAQKP